MYVGMVNFRADWDEDQCKAFMQFVSDQYGVDTATLIKKEEEPANVNES